MKTNTDYIVHMVNDADRVLEILREGYVPNYHMEDLSIYSPSVEKLVYGIPMTSFADVPIEEIMPLMEGEDGYGKYALVMSKQWALNSKNISPIQYISDDDYLKELIRKIKDKQLSPDFVRYSKKYISEWHGKPYCNYVEREWRHALPDSIVKWIEGEDEYYEWRTNAPERPRPTKILEGQALTFDVQDVIQIIIDDHSKKNFLMDSLRKTEKFGGKARHLSDKDCSYIEKIIISTDNLLERKA